ncbi:TetR/AcrR family transcriptional regulator [Cytobacillus sp. IB215316]|uniref:TetR/AcrR family transcriptional regulator n=1 Tax=Cytobacillus sp. IB215316 TaxID=3097354 RepID=UPI002A173183|nr:TetR/AcrR family transcriptional regulator [Cytobacillus sp. IB215316]MDX8360350.1 TetR/AcrR family transcriptional regulator [Cytobacillus sp. IB215316]
MSKGEETKLKILNQALILFSAKGYEETSLKDIATSIHIKAPSIYAYFSGKEELFISVIEYVMSEYIDFIKEQEVVTAKFPTKERLYFLLHELNEYFNNNSLGLFIKRYGIVPPDKFKDLLNRKYNECEKEIRKLLYTILKNHSDNSQFIDDEKIVNSFLCMLDGMLFYLANFSYEEYEKRLNNTWEVFWRGIVKY